MPEEISDTILKKLKKISKDPGGKDGGGKDGGGKDGGGKDPGGKDGGDSDEFKMIIQLLEVSSDFNKQTKAIVIKKQFQQIADQYFPYTVKQDE